MSTTTAGVVVRTSLEGSVERLRDALPVIHVGEDPEGVHQARVATRRLRSDLRVFAPLLDVAWAVDLRRELRWLGRALGRARDADVLFARLEGLSRTWSAAQRAEAAQALEALWRQDLDANVDLRAILAGDRAAALVARLDEAAARPPLTPLAARPAAELMPTLLAAPRAELHEAAARAIAEPTDAAIHRVRIAAKHLRYASEAVAEVLAGATDLAAAAEALQELLGEHQDAVVAEAWLRSFGQEALADAQRTTATDVRARWEALLADIEIAERGLAA
ncbi:MAG TPA: CHAD domain-containing protein [Actinomycetota bacterium]